MSKKSSLYFIFPFLKPLAYLWMQTLGGIYFGVFGGILGALAGLISKNMAKDHEANLVNGFVIAGALAGAFLGTIFAAHFFNPPGKTQSKFILYMRSLTASFFIGTFSWPLAGGFVHLLDAWKTEKDFFESAAVFARGAFRAGEMGWTTLQGWGLVVSVLLIGILFRWFLGIFKKDKVVVTDLPNPAK